MREIHEHATEQVGDSLGRSFEKTFSGNKNITVTKHAVPKKLHRFIVDLDLH